MKGTLIKVGLSAVTMAASVSLATSAEAMVFTDRASWEAAVGSFSLETFNGFLGAPTEGAGLDVGDFTVQQVGTDFGGRFSRIINGSFQGLPSGPAVGGVTAVDGTGVRFTHDSPINFWAADLGGFSDGRRNSGFSIDILGVTQQISARQDFFGFIDTSNSFSVIDVVSFSGRVDGIALDNISYGATPVPTPALLPGLFGMGMAAIRKRKQTATEEA